MVSDEPSAPPLAGRIGAAVRAARTAKGLSTRDLARLVGTSQPFVSNIENGRLFPGVRTLGLLAAALDVPEGDLLPGPERADRADARTRPDDPAAPLLAGPDRILAVLRVELGAGEQEARPHLHDGEEVVLAVAGTIRVLRESAPPVELQPGEALHVLGAVPHRLAGPERGGPAVALVSVTGPRPEEAHR